MSKPLITVVGATGAQGGSVVRYLLKSGKFQIRGVTRDPNAPKAVQLKSQGVEMVKADTKNLEELKAAFKGSHGVFAVTSFWDPEVIGKDLTIELTQGKLMADAAEDQGVKHFIWSSLHDVSKISNDTIKVPHFTQKNQVEQYIKAKSNLPSSFIYAAFYMQNIGTYFVPTKLADGSFQYTFPIDKVRPVPVIDIDEIGALVAHMFINRDKFLGKYVHGAAEYITVDKMMETLARVTGKKVLYNYTAPGKGMGELPEMCRWFNEYGYYNGEDISDAKAIVPGLKTWEQYITASGMKLE